MTEVIRPDDVGFAWDPTNLTRISAADQRRGNGWWKAAQCCNGTPNGASPRAGLGTGVNAIGSPRQMEFGLRLTF